MDEGIEVLPTSGGGARTPDVEDTFRLVALKRSWSEVYPHADVVIVESYWRMPHPVARIRIDGYCMHWNDAADIPERLPIMCAQGIHHWHKVAECMWSIPSEGWELSVQDHPEAGLLVRLTDTAGHLPVDC